MKKNVIFYSILALFITLAGCTANFTLANKSYVNPTGVWRNLDVETAGVKANTDVRNEK